MGGVTSVPQKWFQLIILFRNSANESLKLIFDTTAVLFKIGDRVTARSLVDCLILENVPKCLALA